MRQLGQSRQRAVADTNDDDLATGPITGDFERDLGRNLAVLFGRA